MLRQCRGGERQNTAMPCFLRPCRAVHEQVNVSVELCARWSKQGPGSSGAAHGEASGGDVDAAEPRGARHVRGENERASEGDCGAWRL
jgi:hypothetical protein